jgi:hypothetical protein
MIAVANAAPIPVELYFAPHPPEDADCVVRTEAEVILGLAAGVPIWSGARKTGFEINGKQEEVRALKRLIFRRS